MCPGEGIVEEQCHAGCSYGRSAGIPQMSSSTVSLFSHCRGSTVSPKYCAGAVWSQMCYLCPVHCLRMISRKADSKRSGWWWRRNTEAVVESCVLIPPVWHWLFFCTSDIIFCINRLLNLTESIQGVLRSQRIELLFWKAQVSSTHWKLSDEILKVLKFLEE